MRLGRAQGRRGEHGGQARDKIDRPDVADGSEREDELGGSRIVQGADPFVVCETLKVSRDAGRVGTTFLP